LKDFLKRWAVTTLAVLIAEGIVRGINCSNWTALLVATLILGILNAVLRPLMVVASVGIIAALNVAIGLKLAIVTMPLQLLLFGFLLLAINAALLLVVDVAVPSFEVSGFWAAFWGGVVISVATLILNSLTGSGTTRITLQRGTGSIQRRRFDPKKRGKDGDGPDSGGGPIIDV